MGTLTASTLRYARAWLSGPVDVLERETTLDRDGTVVPATVLRPKHMPGPMPAWVALHGVTRPGRAHAQLVRFTRAVASTGAVVIVPDVPEWRALELTPEVAAPTVRAGLDWLRDTGWVTQGAVGVIGFSFGAAHAIATASDPALAREIAGVAGFGGYCDLERTFRFLMTGLDEGDPRRGPVAPDPYGRWIVAANYLTLVPGFEDHHDVADALRELAVFSGDFGQIGPVGRHEPVIECVRGRVACGRRALFDLFASPGGATPPSGATAEIAASLAAAARSSDPSLDPRPALSRVTRPVHILHGRHDTLIPASEAAEIQRALPLEIPSTVTVTGLFGHTTRNPLPTLFRAMPELPAFFRGLSALLDVPRGLG